jgi:hypothetical protein
VAGAAALAALDADQHALAVDVGHLERCHFGDAQAGIVGDGERGAATVRFIAGTPMPSTD